MHKILFPPPVECLGTRIPVQRGTRYSCMPYWALNKCRPERPQGGCLVGNGGPDRQCGRPAAQGVFRGGAVHGMGPIGGGCNPPPPTIGFSSG